MARPMNPLPTDGSQLAAFAQTLRAARVKAGEPTLKEMSRRSGISIATLSAAHNGTTMPTWPTVQGYIRACGGDPHLWKSRWNALRLARHAEGDVSATTVMRYWNRSSRRLTPLRPVKDAAELAQLLNHLRDFRGLSLRDLARKTPGFSHHTYGVVLRGDRPLTADILVAVLKSCQVGPDITRHWLKELARVQPAEALRAEGWMHTLRTGPRATRLPARATASAAVQARRNGLAAPSQHRRLRPRFGGVGEGSPVGGPPSRVGSE
ncbi:helix-turn-helix transcriptional regulator [Streptomyces olivaceiscleroticus]|uniref:HTH cro/C1-type domain-containing protein n=1 Tax=Streptomyces olivaceiscleroticus TaxID=68245 RepID=A0ABN0ZM66_9ACTN